MKIGDAVENMPRVSSPKIFQNMLRWWKINLTFNSCWTFEPLSLLGSAQILTFSKEQEKGEKERKQSGALIYQSRGTGESQIANLQTFTRYFNKTKLLNFWTCAYLSLPLWWSLNLPKYLSRGYKLQICRSIDKKIVRLIWTSLI